ncbi:MAG: hypothetical protein AAB614_02825 [Patescibacteria group bacterium]
MTKEEKFVVDPLENYFLDKNRSGAKWKIKHRLKNTEAQQLGGICRLSGKIIEKY